MAVAAASDNVRDHWHRYGDYDLLEVFGWAVKLAHLDTAPDAGSWAPMVGATPASALGEPQAAALGRLSVGGKPPRYRWHLGCILLKMPAISLLAGTTSSGGPRRGWAAATRAMGCATSTTARSAMPTASGRSA